jgi:hypothetical protein
MIMQWNWAFGGLGCLGGCASELLRWRSLLTKNQGKITGNSILWISSSVAYIIVGGVLAASLSANTVGALYMGCSWPVLFSGAATQIRKESGKRSNIRGGASEHATSWQVFDQAIFL